MSALTGLAQPKSTLQVANQNRFKTEQNQKIELGLIRGYVRQRGIFAAARVRLAKFE
jgi:hypothetical protein